MEQKIELYSASGFRSKAFLFVAFKAKTAGTNNHNHAIDLACDYFNDIYKGRMVNITNLDDLVSTNFSTLEQQKEDGFTVHAGLEEHSTVQYLKPEFAKLPFKRAKSVTADSAEEW
ncbi:MAG: hypothetical protein JWR61_4703 [Ferruginibacter sp.]|uniref:hypothetical protein n=1 Tax=Ferruginibacter sp. TaxID=1940288 RepID=UPI0026595466|nr:hypothetical protein [Ferruginibacter sp.]MDB5279748.1 hypothetical protein [Ferruginibacter sp.]